MNMIQSQKPTIRSAGISFVSIGCPDFIFCMHAVKNCIGKILGIVVGRRGQSCRKDEPVVCINRRMLLKPIMRLVIFDGPVRIKVPGVFFDPTIFIQFAFKRVCFLLELIQSLIGNRPACRFNQPGIDSKARVIDRPCW